MIRHGGKTAVRVVQKTGGKTVVQIYTIRGGERKRAFILALGAPVAVKAAGGGSVLWDEIADADEYYIKADGVTIGTVSGGNS